MPQTIRFENSDIMEELRRKTGIPLYILDVRPFDQRSGIIELIDSFRPKLQALIDSLPEPKVEVEGQLSFDFGPDFNG